MKKKKALTPVLRTALLLPFFSALIPPQNCLAGADAGQPGSFLLQNPDARGLALGFSRCALPDNAAAVHYNPAGLASLSKPELGLSRTWLFEDTDYSFLAFAYPVGKTSGLGAGYVGQISSGFEKRTTPFDQSGNFSISNRALFLGAGTSVPFSFPLRAGLAVKSVIYDVDTYSDSSFGADAGFSAEPAGGWAFSSVLHNLVKPGIKLVSQKATYYSGFTLAGSYARKLSGGLSASLSAGTRKYERLDAEYSAGLELSYRDSAALRFSAEENGFSSGIGLKSGNYLLDYAVNFHELEQVHTVSLSVRFGITIEELESYIKQGITKFDRKEASKLADAYVQKGDIFYKSRNYPQAVKSFETALLWDPANAATAGKLKTARAEMDAELNKQVIERSSLIAKQFYEKDDLVSSREYWNNVLNLDPSNREAKTYIERIEEKLSRLEKERLEKEKTESVNRQVAAFVTEGTLLLKNEKYAQAQAKAKKALALKPDDAHAKALAAITSEGLSLFVQKRLAEITALCSEKKFQPAAEAIDSLLKEAPEQKKKVGELAGCVQVIQPEITQEQAKRIEMLYYLAVDAYLKDDNRKAAKQLEEIFKLDPLNEMARALSEKIKSAEKISK